MKKKNVVPLQQATPRSEAAPPDASFSIPPDKSVAGEIPNQSPLTETDTFSHAPAGFPVVGIGASAGGLAAFEAFFSGMPADTDPGMAFVLVQHLAPDHKSILSELVRRYTRMQVYEVEDGMTVHPGCCYIIPPNRDMAYLNGALQLMEPYARRGQRLPIDFFFRSLAQDQRERAICIVLSGTGSDGTLGVRAIKGEGGMAMAQNPASTEYDGMPRSAIATGLVDYELPPTEMLAQLIAYAAHAYGKPPRPATVPAPKAENALKKIFVLLRSQTNHDFSLYKPSTIHRRIERRMAVHQIDTMDGYVRYLQQSPTEAEALFRDILIGVTNFFRDPEAAYDMLKKIECIWPVADITLQHRECFDGSGFPRGIKGDAMLIEARILAVAVAVEDLTTHRSYRNAFPLTETLDKISSQSGIKYDSTVVAACMTLFKEKGVTK